MFKSFTTVDLGGCFDSYRLNEEARVVRTSVWDYGGTAFYGDGYRAELSFRSDGVTQIIAGSDAARNSIQVSTPTS